MEYLMKQVQREHDVMTDADCLRARTKLFKHIQKLNDKRSNIIKHTGMVTAQHFAATRHISKRINKVLKVIQLITNARR